MRLRRMNLFFSKKFKKKFPFKSKDEAEILKINFKLIDIWRDLNPDARKGKNLKFNAA